MADSSKILELSITVGDASFAAAGDPDLVLKAYADFQEWARASTGKGSTPTDKRGKKTDRDDQPADQKPGGGGSLELKPFLNQYTLTSNKQRGTALLAWSATKGSKALTFAEIQDLWRKSGFKVPKRHLTRDVRSAETEGWIESEGSGRDERFSVSTYGEGQLATWVADKES